MFNYSFSICHRADGILSPPLRQCFTLCAMREQVFTLNKLNMKRFILSLTIITVAGCNLATQSKSEPVTFVAPESKPSNFETNDSSFLKLKIKDDKFEVDFLKKKSMIENTTSLDSFFKKNNTLIDKEKIVITGLDTTAKNKSLKDMLKKYGFSRIRLNTE